MDKRETISLAPRALVLPTMIVNRQTYFVDSGLRELRNVNDPDDRITFGR